MYERFKVFDKYCQTALTKCCSNLLTVGERPLLCAVSSIKSLKKELLTSAVSSFFIFLTVLWVEMVMAAETKEMVLKIT